MVYPPILTKENFWNELHEKYPLGMKRFCDWIDEYKKRVDWDKVFHVPQYEVWVGSPTGFMKKIGGQEISPAPKYHDIPIGMQIGIFIQFQIEATMFSPHEMHFTDMGGLIRHITLIISALDDRLKTYGTTA